MVSKTLNLALAQISVVALDVQKNLDKHLTYCHQASMCGADVIVFPELSLTGYELASLAETSVTRDSPIAKQLSLAAVKYQTTIIAGCPLSNGDNKPFIGALICHPSGHIETYSKQYLHSGESEYCCAGSSNHFIEINNHKLALAICADFTSSQHYQDAIAANADIYVVSALISKGGFEEDSKILSSIATDMQRPVLLSNFIGMTGGWDTAGRASVWSRAGDVLAQGSNTEEGLILCSVLNNEITDVDIVSIYF